jgi:hypothetical protein
MVKTPVKQCENMKPNAIKNDKQLVKNRNNNDNNYYNRVYLL